MEILLYGIPFIVAIFLLVFAKRKIVFWEYLLLIIPCLFLTFITEVIIKEIKTDDIEYLGGYILKTRHYDEWDEWITQTCTRQVAVGRDEDGNTIYETEEYDCSYRKYHPEHWTYFTNENHEVPCNEGMFYEIRQRFNNPNEIFVDMHRHYYTIDGDAHDYCWPNTRQTIRTITRKGHYKNKVKSSNSIFKYKHISKKQAKELSLFEYPEIIDEDQIPILYKTVKPNKNEIDAVKYINGYYGKRNQIRVYILLFNPSDDIEKAFQQQAYWEGGNKNELIVCFGLNQDRSVNWCYSFSWEDVPKLPISTMEKYRNNEKLDIVEYIDWLIPNLNKWKRKEFKDFKYIQIELSQTDYYIVLFIVILYLVFISLYVIKNEFDNEKYLK